MVKRTPEATINRLSRYYRSLINLQREGVEITSSKELSKRDKVSPAQVRKDLSLFGSFGIRGVGYHVVELSDQLASILGLNRRWRVGMVGAGNVGSALTTYKEFQRQGFDIVAIFDIDRRKIGHRRGDLIVEDVAHLRSVLKRRKVEIVIIAVPAREAQAVADEVVAAGIMAILNFAPTNLRVPEQVLLHNENIAFGLEVLSCYLTEGKRVCSQLVTPCGGRGS